MTAIDLELMRNRHSVRSFSNEPLPANVREALEAKISAGNAAGNLHMKLVCNEPEAFDSAMAHYGKFTGVQNYLVLAGPASDDLEERCGYYGQQVALLAQQLGLNTCWVALTFKRRYVKKHLQPGDKLVVVVALGYGETQGVSHKVKTAAEVSNCAENSPEWFKNGIEAALLAPTAMNQQKFKIELLDEDDAGTPEVSAKSLGGAYSNVDLGIVKYHFELGAAGANFTWK